VSSLKKKNAFLNVPTETAMKFVIVGSEIAERKILVLVDFTG